MSLIIEDFFYLKGPLATEVTGSSAGTFSSFAGTSLTGKKACDMEKRKGNKMKRKDRAYLPQIKGSRNSLLAMKEKESPCELVLVFHPV